VPVGDADALAKKVIETVHNPAPIPFDPRFTATAMAAQVLAVYQAVI
jgi:hypothetical protein